MDCGELKNYYRCPNKAEYYKKTCCNEYTFWFCKEHKGRAINYDGKRLRKV